MHTSSHASISTSNTYNGYNMNDFVVRRLDGDTFNSLYFKNGRWIGTSEQASKLSWSQAEYIRNWYMRREEDAFYDLMLRKDSTISDITKELQEL